MRIAILGCGAMGTVLGAVLTHNGQPVEMIDACREHVDALGTKGAWICGSTDFTVPVTAYTPDEMHGKYDLVFLFTKRMVNQEVLTHLLPYLKEDSTVCTLQNGVPESGVAEIIGANRTVGGTVLWSSTFIGPGVSKLTHALGVPRSYFEVGEMDGSVTERIQMVAGVLKHMGTAEISTNLMGSRWYKCIGNSCISAVGAALGSLNHVILDDPKSLDCSCFIAKEGAMVCAAAGVKMGMHDGEDADLLYGFQDQVGLEKMRSFLINLLTTRGLEKASLMQDLEKGRKTEIHMINGYICEEGRRLGIPTPINDDIVSIIEGIEEGRYPLSYDNIQFFPTPSF